MVSSGCKCGEKRFKLAGILVNGGSAVVVDLGKVCQLYGEKRIEELRSIYKNSDVKQLKAALLPQEKVELIE